MFKNPFSFKGRIRRLEYGLSVIIGFTAMLVAGSLSAAQSSNAVMVVVVLIYVPSIQFLLAQGAKRCHDRGATGLWQIIPFYGWIMLFGEGDPGSNEYGPNPKGIEYHDDWDPIANETKEKEASNQEFN
ncbi:DUF805 domain-containing protein [Pedobacter frigoris]|uniref:DUF805 domain-containing protein n=1 Tax=Pedobacter frigoris TaxID=2571272 RepID=A0A4U1CIZ1_9SPHI|nr:DUF805 domain-containing protein [Pedobacter frigoris]TKC06950.1 DUF805 domain-containing protein [Pedobacter frigoris]